WRTVPLDAEGLLRLDVTRTTTRRRGDAPAHDEGLLSHECELEFYVPADRLPLTLDFATRLLGELGAAAQRPDTLPEELARDEKADATLPAAAALPVAAAPPAAAAPHARAEEAPPARAEEAPRGRDETLLAAPFLRPLGEHEQALAAAVLHLVRA